MVDRGSSPTELQRDATVKGLSLRTDVRALNGDSILTSMLAFLSASGRPCRRTETFASDTHGVHEAAPCRTVAFDLLLGHPRPRNAKQSDSLYLLLLGQ